MDIALSFGVFLFGLGVAYFASNRWRTSAVTDRNSLWWWGITVLWIALAVFFVSVTISDIGFLAMFIGIGVSLIGWGMCTWGLARSFEYQQSAKDKLRAVFDDNPELEERFYSSRWINWLLPKRKNKNPP